MVLAAEELAPIFEAIAGPELPVRVETWDGSGFGPLEARTRIRVSSPTALRRILYAPNELGLSRAYVAGELDIDGDVFDVLALRSRMATSDSTAQLSIDRRTRQAILRALRRLGALGPPPPPPPEEAALRGHKHSKRRDATAIHHHYDVGNDFYRLVLGNSMTYSCAYFASGAETLAEAQSGKHELVARKLGLEPGMRVLDVGCGWGEMAIHAAKEHGVRAVGVTISEAQAELAAKRVAEAGLADRIEIRLQDYRDVRDGPYDAISSIGMFEHVGRSQLQRYFSVLYDLLAPRGRLLNHAISRMDPSKSGFGRDSFIARYVFPDGELLEVGTVVTTMQGLGYEVRHVESLREHYAQTLRCWVRNLEENWEKAVHLVGPARARVWRLYMAGSAVNFEAGRIGVHQVLGVKQAPDGSSGMPRTATHHVT